MFQAAKAGKPGLGAQGRMERTLIRAAEQRTTNIEHRTSNEGRLPSAVERW
jgi:hypothetical protein